MMKIVLHTQIHENYGAHDWDGKGQCPQYWKAKGGESYEVQRDLSEAEVSDAELVFSLVKKACAKVSHKSDYYKEFVIDWEFVTPDYLTPDEKCQLEWEGKISYPRTKLALV